MASLDCVAGGGLGVAVSVVDCATEEGAGAADGGAGVPAFGSGVGLRDSADAARTAARTISSALDSKPLVTSP